MTKRNKWNRDEIDFLLLNYKNKGLTYIIKNLSNHTRNSIVKKAKELGVKVDQSIYHYNENDIKDAVKLSHSYMDVFRKLNKSISGDSYKCLKRYIKNKDINTSHFNSWKNNRIKKKNKSIDEWLRIGTTITSSKLKEKLYNNGIKPRVCELCGQDEWWCGKKMSLILDHINGINNDNRLENLRIVCPNCEGTLETHCRGNKMTHKKTSKQSTIKTD